MPELPDVELYLHALRPRLVGREIHRIRLASPFLVRTTSPDIQTLVGRPVVGLRRLGKRIHGAPVCAPEELLQARPLPPATYHFGVMAIGASSACGISGADAAKPRSLSAAAASAAPVRSAAWVDRCPAAAPAEVRPGGPSRPGTKAAIASFHTGRER